MAAKKTKFHERKERFQSGGGPPPASEPSSGEDIAVWLPHEFTIETNEFDSDNQNFQEIKKKNLEQVPQYINIEKNKKTDDPIPCENSGYDIIETMFEPSTSTQPEGRTTTTTTTTTKPIKGSRTSKDGAALQIAETETTCRKALHEAQMANEKQKFKNVVLKEQVLKAKLQYYKNKLN